MFVLLIICCTVNCILQNVCIGQICCKENVCNQISYCSNLTCSNLSDHGTLSVNTTTHQTEQDIISFIALIMVKLVQLTSAVFFTLILLSAIKTTFIHILSYSNAITIKKAIINGFFYFNKSKTKRFELFLCVSFKLNFLMEIHFYA